MFGPGVPQAIVMSTKEESKSLRAVESLQRRQDAVEREMTTIDAKLKVCLLYSHLLSLFRPS